MHTKFSCPACSKKTQIADTLNGPYLRLTCGCLVDDGKRGEFINSVTQLRDVKPQNVRSLFNMAKQYSKKLAAIREIEVERELTKDEIAVEIELARRVMAAAASCKLGPHLVFGLKKPMVRFKHIPGLANRLDGETYGL